MFVYSGLAVTALVHTLVKTSRDEKRASGLTIVLAGLGAALVPTMVTAVDWTLFPNFDIPGSGWFPLMFGAIPLTMAMAVRKHAESEGFLG